MPWYDYVNNGFLLLLWCVIMLKIRMLYKERKNWLLFFASYSLTELIALVESKNGNSNLWIYNIASPIQLILAVSYLCMALRVDRVKSFLILILLGTISFIFYFQKNYNEYNSLEKTTNGGIIIICCALYFYKVITADVNSQNDLSEFWYCSALFIFFGTSLCVDGAFNYLIEHNIVLAHRLFYILVANSIVFYSLNLYALIRHRQS